MDNFLGKLCDSQYNLGIKYVFDAFQEEIDENWTVDVIAHLMRGFQRVNEPKHFKFGL